MTGLWRALPALLMLLGVAGAAAVLGRPDTAAAGGLLRGGYPTYHAALALVELLLWAGIAAAAVAVGFSTARASADTVLLLRRRRNQGLVVFLTGALLLCAGAARHAAPVSMCCGNALEASSLGH